MSMRQHEYAIAKGGHKRVGVDCRPWSCSLPLILFACSLCQDRISEAKQHHSRTYTTATAGQQPIAGRGCAVSQLGGEGC